MGNRPVKAISIHLRWSLGDSHPISEVVSAPPPPPALGGGGALGGVSEGGLG